MAIVGFGGLGQEIAVRTKAFGLRVLAVRRDPTRPSPWADEVHGTESLHTVLTRADFVVLCAPATDATRGLIDADALRRMHPEAFLINVARGDLVDEEALFRALTEGWIAGVWVRRVVGLCRPASVRTALPCSLPSGDSSSSQRRRRRRRGGEHVRGPRPDDRGWHRERGGIRGWTSAEAPRGR